MNKLALMAIGAAVALALPSTASAQDPAGTITATATVNSLFGTEGTQNLVFDAVNPNETTAVDVMSGTGGTPGYIEFGYNANHEIKATTLPATLSDGLNDLPVTWECGTSTAVETRPAAKAACADGATVYTSPEVTEAGTIVLWLGGSIDAPDNALVGTYTGSITFTISGI